MPERNQHNGKPRRRLRKRYSNTGIQARRRMGFWQKSMRPGRLLPIKPTIYSGALMTFWHKLPPCASK
jgi:hypothetical protein